MPRPSGECLLQTRLFMLNWIDNSLGDTLAHVERVSVISLTHSASFVVCSWFCARVDHRGRGSAGSVSFVTATDEHDGGLYDSDYALREAITAANAYASSAGIPFSVTAR